MGVNLSVSWPRGFPLELIRSPGVAASSGDIYKIKSNDVAVVQSMANNDPDIDAVHRMTNCVHFDFESIELPSIRFVPKNKFVPYNAQATIHIMRGLTATLLPVTVQGRVSDIWRSYFSQALFRHSNLIVALSSPRVEQKRNIHNYLADFSAESDLYLKTGKLIEFLHLWRPKTKGQSLHWNLAELWEQLFERNYIEEDDVKLALLWANAIDYIQGKKKCVNKLAIMVQYNWVTPVERIDMIAQKWSEFLTPHVISAIPNTGSKLLHPNYYYYTQDRGYFSPYLNLAWAAKKNKKKGFQGLLYVHDDMLLTSVMAKTLQNVTPNTWLVSHEYKQIHKAQKLKNGKFLWNEEPKWWSRWEQCKNSFNTIFKDPKFLKFFPSNTTMTIIIGQSDFAYIDLTNSEALNTFFTLVKIFNDHKTFLECALPTLIFYTQLLSPLIKVKSIRLCTSWEKNRNNFLTWECMNNITKIDAIHPVKGQAFLNHFGTF